MITLTVLGSERLRLQGAPDGCNAYVSLPPQLCLQQQRPGYIGCASHAYPKDYRPRIGREKRNESAMAVSHRILYFRA